MIGKNFIVKNFSEHNVKKFALKISYCCREIVKIPKLFHSVMTSMTMFTSD